MAVGGRPYVLFVTSEIYPFSKSGGLGDVMGALPKAMHDLGVDARVITPLHGRIDPAEFNLRLVSENCLTDYPWPGTTCEVYQADYAGVPVYFIAKAEYFDRKLYYNTHIGDYFDNCERFNFFARAVIQWCRHLETPPALIHVNDWQSALVPVYTHFLRESDPFWRDVKTVMTIHNLAFQGRFSSRLFWESGVPRGAWNPDGVEYYGDFNLLKGGIAYADAVTTVSPAYSLEILSPQFGCGLEGILNKRRRNLSGIINGADYTVWDPAHDDFLACSYTPEDLSGKRRCKARMIRELFLSDLLEDMPVLGFIGRLRDQKGIDLLIDIIPRLMAQDLGLVVLGEGDLSHEAELLNLMEVYQGKLSVQVGYTEELAHIIQAGSDIFLMPSRYEPCGLTQMYALRYGTPPVATAVGGLIDTITPHPSPESTGFFFEKPDSELFFRAIQRALRTWQDKPYWQAMIRRAMNRAFTWDRSAREYLKLYRNLGADFSYSALGPDHDYPVSARDSLREDDVMKMQEVRKMAKDLGIKTGGVSKMEAVRAIQRAEGNFDCFGRAFGGFCDQSDCLFYEECIRLSNDGKK